MGAIGDKDDAQILLFGLVCFGTTYLAEIVSREFRICGGFLKWGIPGEIEPTT